MEPCYTQTIAAEPNRVTAKTVSEGRADGSPERVPLIVGCASHEGSQVWVRFVGSLRGWRDKKGVPAEVRKDGDPFAGTGGIKLIGKRPRVR